jgi:HPt (histidine-containing phosphotransfer) domain-containing protein
VDPHDADTLATLRKQMGEEMPDLIAIFTRESGAHLAAIRAGIATGELWRARNAAHALTSSAALFGLHALAKTMRAIEALPDDAPREAWLARLDEAVALRDAGLGWISRNS